MSQHFLLSAKARTLSVRKVMEMTHDQAFRYSGNSAGALARKRFARCAAPSTGIISI